MRLDKYLKVSRLIKRRTVANEVALDQAGDLEIFIQTHWRYSFPFSKKAAEPCAGSGGVTEPITGCPSGTCRA